MYDSISPSTIKQVQEKDMIMIVNPAVDGYDGECSLADIPFLHALGYGSFSYRSSWRTRDTSGRPTRREPDAYKYFSLADDRKLRSEHLPSSLACITTQEMEKSIISVSPLVKCHLNNQNPKRLCLITETSGFALRFSGERPLPEEPFFGWDRILSHEDTLVETKQVVMNEVRLDCSYCSSWSQIGWALAMFLLEDAKYDNTGDLISGTFEAPYLALWEDVTELTYHGDERPETLRAPIDKPWLCISRHYGMTVNRAQHMWDEIERRMEDVGHTHYRLSVVKTKFRDRLERVWKEYGSRSDILGSLVRQSVLDPKMIGQV